MRKASPEMRVPDPKPSPAPSTTTVPVSPLEAPFLPAILLRNPEGQSLLPDFKPGQEAFARGDVEGAADLAY